MKNKFLQYAFLGMSLSLCLQHPALSGEPGTAVKLGLDLATAMADQKDVAEGLKKVGMDRTEEWLWGQIGGVEMLLRSTSEASIPSARKKLLDIVELVDNIEKFTIAMAEGRYDDALFTAIDQTVSIVDHPLVNVVWAVAKLTYESHKLVQSTQAAVEIERIFNLVNNDRRLMGTGASKDQPNLIPETGASADYFYQKYVVTDTATRQLFRTYVEKEIGDVWPVETWGEWARSWMAIGSGADQAQDTETLRLAEEGRNKARAWIMHLIKNVNHQATAYWGQVRLRQEQAAFQEFSHRMSYIMNNDFDRILEEWKYRREQEQALPQFREALAQSRQQRPLFQTKIDSGDYKDERNGARIIADAVANYGRQTYWFSQRAGYGGDQQLSRELLEESKAWQSMAQKFLVEIEGTREETLREQTQEGLAFPVAPGFEQFSASIREVEAIIRRRYEREFGDILVPFEFGEQVLTVEAEVAGRTSTHQVWGDPEAVQQAMLDYLNQGRFDLARALIHAWTYNGAGGHIQNRRRAVERKVLLLRQPTVPAGDRRRIGTGEVLSERESGSWFIVRGRVIRTAEENLRMLDDLDSTVQQQTLTSLREMYNVFDELRKTRQEQYEKYRKVLDDLDRFYERDITRLNWMKDGLARQLQTLKDNTHTLVVPLRHETPTLYILPVLLRRMADTIEVGRRNPQAPQHLVAGMEDIARRWGERKWTWDNMPVLSSSDLNQIVVLVDPEFDYSGVNSLLNKRDSEVTNSIRSAVAAAAQYAQLAATDWLNRDNDADWLRRHADRFKEFMARMVAEELCHYSAPYAGAVGWDFRLAVEIDHQSRMAIMLSPYARYATAPELARLADPVRSAWQSSGLDKFMQQQAPDHLQAFQEMLELPYVERAPDDNFIKGIRSITRVGGVPTRYDDIGPVIYAEHIEAANRLIDGLTPGDPAFDTTMTQVAAILPAVLNLQTEEERSRTERLAEMAGMTVEEYRIKMRIRADSFTVRTDALSHAPGTEFPIGRAYAEMVAKLTDFTRAHHSYLQAEVNRVREEQRRREAEEAERRRAAAALAAEQQRQEQLQQLTASVQEFYDQFARNYSRRSLTAVLGMLDPSWNAADGSTLLDLEETLDNSFRIFDEVECRISDVRITAHHGDTVRVEYKIAITGHIYRNRIRHQENSQVSEEIRLDNGRTRIIRTLDGRFW